MKSEIIEYLKSEDGPRSHCDIAFWTHNCPGAVGETLLELDLEGIVCRTADGRWTLIENHLHPDT